MASFFRVALCSLLAIGASSRQFNIPQVDAAVDHALAEYSNYTAYYGSPATASHAGHDAHVNLPRGAEADANYWLAQIAHSGKSAFNGNSGYTVWRNVKDFGAKGDGVSDDTNAINAAISSGGRCAPGSCQSTTTTPAIVYFPAGTYMVSAPIIDYYYTQLIGNPNSRAVVKATSNFNGFAIIDADPYQSNGNQAYGSTNVFFRQIRNLVIDLTAIPATTAANALHWPTSQSTSLQNIQINLSQASGTQHVGIFCENGSAGFLGDVVIYGGKWAFNIGNQQFTLRNVQIYNAIVAINQLWSWGFTYKSLQISNCSTGIDMSSADGSGNQYVGAVTILDSSFTNVGVAVKTTQDTSPHPATAGTLVLENVAFSNVGTGVRGGSGATLLGGGSTTVGSWAQGHSYTPNGPTNMRGGYSASSRPGSLVSNGKYYENSKPLYVGYTTGQVLTARSMGAKGDANTDDTAAVNKLLSQAAANNQIAFFDAGTYKVTDTIYMPPNSRVVGEPLSAVIMSSGSAFNSMNSPKAVVQIGHSGDSGLIQWSDMLVSTQGAQAGAILIEWNMAASSGSGMWDVHARVGGFAGSSLQVAQCPTSAAVSPNCYAAYMTMHVTKTATNVYLENVWLWTADHDLDDASSTQISVYTGRGLLWESTAGPGWLYGTSVEHHQMYQYQFANTQNIVIGYAQTETPYYQPSPDAKSGPYPVVTSLNDPNYNTLCTLSGNCDAFGLRILNSKAITIYGAGLYSFFNHYSTTCSNVGGTENCQSAIFDIENSSGISVYDLNTVGSQCMVYRDGKCLANYGDNASVFADTMAVFTAA